ncbi:MAG: PEP-CTERM sorting domain-containing protein [Planctomycetes bacterium]|nr:PEP-CTERM sorting domain-containing protein [Planctomycetota bacterium]
MKSTILIVSILLVVLLASGDASAGRYWSYSPVLGPDGRSLGNGSSAIGMRSGNTWPVVAYSGYYYGGNDGGAAAMMPGYWLQGPVGFYGQMVTDGATAPDGTVGFVGHQGSVVTLGRNGWSGGFYSGSTYYRGGQASISFNNDSELGVLYKNYSDQLTLAMRSGGTWHQSTLINGYNSSFRSYGYALDFDSYNQANVVLSENNRFVFGSKGVMSSGQWVFDDPANPSYNGPFTRGYVAMDMALTSNDIPYVVYAEQDLLKYAVYDRQTSGWSGGIIDSLRYANFVVKSDDNGGIGVAYVTDYDNTLSFAYTDGSSGFGVERLTEADPMSFVGLAFDFEGNPVISYDNNHGELWIAYDPVVIPEPATIAMLLIGGCLALRRRK